MQLSAGGYVPVRLARGVRGVANGDGGREPDPGDRASRYGVCFRGLEADQCAVAGSQVGNDEQTQYGIPQARPGDVMASAGPDWQSDAATQIKWGLGYIKETYGTPCVAWQYAESYGTY
jgi:hypothetical protein